MAYSFRLTDESVDAGLRRIATSQIETGLSEIRDEDLSLADRVHQARKRCKKVRGLLRLVRPAFPSYSEENVIFRDAARTLSATRDASAMLESLDALEAHHEGQLRKAALAPLRRALETREADIDRDEAEEKLSDMRLVFREALDRLQDWSLDANGADAFAPGAAKTYKRARKAMKAARKSGEAEDFHGWRKRVKYHWYHVRLMKKIWPPIMKDYAEQAQLLSRTLGEHHDLAVLKQAAPELLGRKDVETAELLDALATTRQETLEADALERGAKLLAEKPSSLAARWASWWHTDQELDRD